MIWKWNGARGSSSNIPKKKYPDFPKAEQCASERYWWMKSPVSAKTSSRDSGCTEVSMHLLWAWTEDQAYEIKIYVFFKPLNIFIVVVQYSLMAWGGRWVLQNPEDLSKPKRSKTGDEIVHWRDGQRVWWGNPVCCSSWDFVALPCPLHKMLHTLVKTHTVPPSHEHGNMLYVNFLALL